ncbi:hypothetical protein [Pedobacter helvus]|uniref:Outer membrane protein beta-barrel domain-containing protein n=1 Tax=Pedobacter helvus TaxID=2563444 RepID=A0ABW9JG59_9SPHI|nr:hypothetical protein [Pedobacter ureilyticus]
MKKRYLALLLVLFTVTAFGQSNFYKLSVGAGTGGTYSFTDVQKGSFGFASYANLDYNFTPFITGGLEIQMGLVKGGNRVTDPHKREFTNAYQAVMLNTKFRAGEFTDFYYSDFLNYTKGFYLGTGLGYIKNNMNSIVREKLDESGNLYTFPGDDKSSGIVIPINIGIDFYFPDGWGDIRYTLNFNYQTNIVTGEGLDGYNDPKTKFKNNAADIYNFLSVGFKYNFGPKGLTNKTIR